VVVEFVGGGEGDGVVGVPVRVVGAVADSVDFVVGEAGFFGDDGVVGPFARVSQFVGIRSVP
jgi:hypothetical protein